MCLCVCVCVRRYEYLNNIFLFINRKYKLQLCLQLIGDVINKDIDSLILLPEMTLQRAALHSPPIN